MSSHQKNGSFSGILLKQPPKLKSNKENSKRNSIVNISSRIKPEQESFKRPRTQVAIKGNTSFNIRNTNNHIQARYSSAKQQKYQQQIQKQLCSPRNDLLAISQPERSKNFSVQSSDKKTEKTFENRSQIFSLKLTPHPDTQDCINSEHEKQSTADEYQRIGYAQKIQEILISQIQVFAHNSKRRYKKRKMLNLKKKQRKDPFGNI